MKLLWSVIINILLIQAVIAQDGDTVVLKRRNFQPRIYWDYGKTLMLWSNQSKKYEGGLELLIIDRIQLIAEAGSMEFIPSNLHKNITYQSKGNFYRIGTGSIAYLDDINRIGLGFRYAKSSFSDMGTTYINSESGFNAPLNIPFERSDLQATWAEFIVNSEKYIKLKKEDPNAAINKRLSLGLMIRYKILLDYPDYEPIGVFNIPGYRRLVNNRVLALNLFVKINL